jgi:hypothetical protein
MDAIHRSQVPIARLPGRDVQRIVGKGAAIASGRMTVGTAHYSEAAGPMEPHHHAEETIVVLAADRARVRWGPAPDDLPESLDLEPGLVLHFPEWEWHVFEWEPGGSGDVVVIYGQVDDIRPEDVGLDR